ncbi:MAG: Crp/Fnr family transcriptional regulator [Pseudomonadota bacterium]
MSVVQKNLRAGTSDDRLQTVRSCHLFSGADGDSLVPLAAASYLERFSSGGHIFAAQDEADGLRIVLSGQVRIWIDNSEGRELTLALLGDGDPFGEIALLDGLPRTANATCLEETSCLFLPAHAMQVALANDAALARHLVLSLCEMLRQNIGTINGFAFAGLVTRLALKLQELAVDHAEIDGQTARFTRRFSQTDLAHLLGVTREAVNKRLKVLEHDGLIVQDGGRLVIPDMSALAARTTAL